MLGSLSQSFVRQAAAHGSVEYPKSRVLHVYEGLSKSPRPVWTVQATAIDNENSYYTWAQLSRNFPTGATEDANTFTTYTANIPDGKLASANNMPNPEMPNQLSYSGLDTVSSTWEWPATAVTPGQLTVRWNAPATHNPSFFKVWLSKQSYDYRTPLKWSDLEYLGQPAHTLNGQIYSFNVNLPQRTGHQVMYVAWQRIDPVGEVFFSTSDLDFGGGSSTPATPVLSFSPAAVQVNEDAGNVTVTATLSAPAPSTGVTANYATSAGTASAADFTAKSGAVNFSAGETSKTITIPITNDTAQESDEIFTVALSGITGANGGQTTATVTIKDNDAPPSSGSGAAFNIYDNWGTGWRANLDLTNGSGSAWNNWTLEFDAPWTINGNVTNAGTTTKNGNHYTITPANWNTSIASGGVLHLEFGTATSDTTPPTNIKINGQPVAGLVPGVSVAPVSVTEGSGAGNAVITISLEGAHTSPIYVSYATSNGTAVAGTDYTAASGSVTFAPGETSKTVNVPITGNTSAQPDRTFTVSLAGVTGQPLPRFVTGKQSATVTILDDDGGGSNGTGTPLVLTGDTVIEGNSGTKNAVFTFKLKNPVGQGQTVSLNYSTSNVTANSGTDYTPVSGTLTIPAGSSTATVNVPVNGDTTDEALELFQLTLSGVTGCNPLNTSAVCQIIDDDMAPNAYGNQRIVGYIDGTSGNSNLPPANRLTHLMVAFANVDSDGNLFFPVAIDFSGINALKNQNPSLKVLLSIGGWEWSAPFPAVADDATKRGNFATSCRQKTVELGLDGIDIDWEWPGGGGNSVPRANDSSNFTELVKGVRQALDSLGASNGKSYELTCYAPANPNQIASWDLAQLKNYFHFFNVQGYDLHGAWENRTGHQSALKHSASAPADDKLDIEATMAIYRAANVPASQLLVGAGFYGQAWNSANPAQNGLYQNANPYGQITYGTIAGGPLKEYLRTWDADAKVPWLFDALGNQQVVCYDDPQSLFEKANYSRANGYSGVFFWQLNGDTADRQLLVALSDTMASTPSTNADSDGDGIPDAWEQSNFGNLSTANATSDNDGDGASDYFEWLSRTNPKNRASLLTAEIHDAGSAVPMVMFPSVSGVSYRIERSLNLGAWTSIGTVAGTGGQIHYQDTTLPAGSRRVFYRLAPLP